MADIDTMPRQQIYLPELLMTIFLRVVAAGCLWYAIGIWADLIGYGAKGTLRIDLLNRDMQAAVAALALLYPVTAIGLWLKGSWGPVMWTVAAAVEIARYESLHGSLANATPTLLMIVATALVYIAFRLTLWLKKPPKPASNFAER